MSARHTSFVVWLLMAAWQGAFAATTVAGDDAAVGLESPTVVAQRFLGMCDASAAVALDDQTFLVADDERNVILAYNVERPDEPVAEWNWSQHLYAPPGQTVAEADIEAATRVGDVVYWLASHGRNLNGKWRPSRHQYFATQVSRDEAGKWQLAPVGQAFGRLAARLIQEPQLAAFDLRSSLGPSWVDDEQLAPKAKGFCLEGLAAAPDGRTQWLGFRNPIPQGQALLVPWLNADAGLREQADPSFGPPVMIRLHVKWQGHEYDLAIRSIEYCPALATYLIIAGPASSQRVSALYAWQPDSAPTPKLLTASKYLLQAGDFNPEALIVYPTRGEIQLLSDDGANRVAVGSAKECAEDAFDHGYCEQKSLLNHQRQAFRSLRIPLKLLVETSGS